MTSSRDVTAGGLGRGGRETLVIAHRGLTLATPGEAPDVVRENSLDSFERAIAVGADLVECDVRRTRDGALVALHDGTVAGRPIGDLTYDELVAVSPERPPRLEEVLDVVGGRVGLDVEFKEDGYVDDAMRRILEVMPVDRVLVTSFLDSVVARAKQVAPEVRTGLVLGRRASFDHGVRGMPAAIAIRRSELYPVARLEACHADYAVPHVVLALLGTLRRAWRAGYPSLVWTVNDNRGLRSLLADIRVAGVITDRPGLALALDDAPPTSGPGTSVIDSPL